MCRWTETLNEDDRFETQCAHVSAIRGCMSDAPHEISYEASAPASRSASTRSHGSSNGKSRSPPTMRRRRTQRTSVARKRILVPRIIPTCQVTTMSHAQASTEGGAPQREPRMQPCAAAAVPTTSLQPSGSVGRPSRHRPTLLNARFARLQSARDVALQSAEPEPEGWRLTCKQFSL